MGKVVGTLPNSFCVHAHLFRTPFWEESRSGLRSQRFRQSAWLFVSSEQERRGSAKRVHVSVPRMVVKWKCCVSTDLPCFGGVHLAVDITLALSSKARHILMLRLLLMELSF